MITPNGFENNTTAVLNVSANPATGTELPGNTVTLTLNFSAPVNVTGTPTLALNDGGTAVYTGGSGTKALAFRYTVATSDSEVSNLAITQVNLPAGATIKDVRGRAANLTNALATLWGLAIETHHHGGRCRRPDHWHRFTTDDVAGDHITNDSTLTLTAVRADGTVNIFDGTKLLDGMVWHRPADLVVRPAPWRTVPIALPRRIRCLA